MSNNGTTLKTIKCLNCETTITYDSMFSGVMTYVECPRCHARYSTSGNYSPIGLKPKTNETIDPMVSHPRHYQSETGMEVIDVIEAFTFDLKGIEAFDTGNVLKYICRWKQKDDLRDLNKAKWYLQHLIDHVTKMKKENEKHD